MRYGEAKEAQSQPVTRINGTVTTILRVPGKIRKNGTFENISEMKNILTLIIKTAPEENNAVT